MFGASMRGVLARASPLAVRVFCGLAVPSLAIAHLLHRDQEAKGYESSRLDQLAECLSRELVDLASRSDQTTHPLFKGPVVVERNAEHKVRHIGGQHFDAWFSDDGGELTCCNAYTHTKTISALFVLEPIGSTLDVMIRFHTLSSPNKEPFFDSECYTFDDVANEAEKLAVLVCAAQFMRPHTVAQ